MKECAQRRVFVGDEHHVDGFHHVSHIGTFSLHPLEHDAFVRLLESAFLQKNPGYGPHAGRAKERGGGQAVDKEMLKASVALVSQSHHVLDHRAEDALVAV